MRSKPERELKPGSKLNKGLIGLSFAILLGILGGYAYVKVNPPSSQPAEVDLSKETFRVGTLFKNKTLHPYDLYGHPLATALIYDYLTVPKLIIEKDTFVINNSLLESLEIIGDGREVVAHIRKNVYFHNGAILKADDVIFTFRQQMSSILTRKPLLNAKEFKFEKSGEFSIRCTYTKPIDWRLFFLSQAILNEEYELSWKGKNKGNYIPMGSGPYRYASYDEVTGVLKMERFNKHWRGEPSIGNFEYIPFEKADASLQAMVEGKIDYLANISPEDQEYLLNRGTGAVNIGEFVDFYSYNLIFNNKNPKFEDWRVRRGISRLINRYEMVNDKYALNYIGKMADTPFHMSFPQTKPTVEPYDPAKGMRLLEEAGYKKKSGWYEKDGKRLEVEILNAKYNQGYLHVLRLIERQLGVAGVLCRIRNEAWDELSMRFKKYDFEIVFMNLSDQVSVSSNYAFYGSKGFSNISGYKDKLLEELFNQSEVQMTSVENKIAIQDRIREKAPSITLFYKKNIVAINNRYLGEWFSYDPFTLYFIGDVMPKNTSAH